MFFFFFSKSSASSLNALAGWISQACQSKDLHSVSGKEKKKKKKKKDMEGKVIFHTISHNRWKFKNDQTDDCYQWGQAPLIHTRHRSSKNLRLEKRGEEGEGFFFRLT